MYLSCVTIIQMIVTQALAKMEAHVLMGSTHLSAHALEDLVAFIVSNGNMMTCVVLRDRVKVPVDVLMTM